MSLNPKPAGLRIITSHRLRGSVAMVTLAVGGLTIAGVTGLALAGTSPMLGVAKNSTVGKTIVVDAHGLTI